MNKLTVTDNYLSDVEFNLLQQTTASGANFDWCQHQHNPDDNALCNHQFTHMIYSGGEWISDKRDLFEPVIRYFSALAVIRVKVNLLLSTPEPYFGGFHVDCERADIARSGVLYLDDSNGPTEFETGQKVECVSNRFVEFPANIRHGSWTCTNRPYRRAINFNWIPHNE